MTLWLGGNSARGKYTRGAGCVCPITSLDRILLYRWEERVPFLSQIGEALLAHMVKDIWVYLSIHAPAPPALLDHHLEHVRGRHL
jgi:hypothetical protein